ncbi:hypothetical protein O7606_05350 [Micromonospora sp. WMMD882]|uniref:hypothetical protein n=1 Tax=Micromonospora sp. WMMD882 TaxID=3015151 RepID=UPI00248BA37A|nr:hypothetical protein [Micromonospora sp. WMMD882]WBB80814.1 hypothetical protein O7606_05350 [Micromonospora sp. WMMD882]
MPRSPVPASARVTPVLALVSVWGRDLPLPVEIVVVVASSWLAGPLALGLGPRRSCCWR